MSLNTEEQWEERMRVAAPWQTRVKAANEGDSTPLVSRMWLRSLTDPTTSRSFGVWEVVLYAEMPGWPAVKGKEVVGRVVLTDRVWEALVREGMGVYRVIGTHESRSDAAEAVAGEVLG